MNLPVELDMSIRINKVWFEGEYIFIKLSDNRIIGNPIKWYKNLSKGSQIAFNINRFCLKFSY